MTALAPREDVELEVAVIGAGFSGLYMLHRLRNVQGLKVRVFDNAPRVGGTWYWNRYPGARCDTESYIYCYSFSEELYQEWNWSGRYPRRDELLSYLEHVADRFDLYPDISLNSTVTAAEWEPHQSRWRLTIDGCRTVTAKFLVTAIGILTAAPYLPEVEGMVDFAGSVHHTRNWPDPPPDLSDAIVGVVGTGSTGAQMIPTLAEQVRELVVFQRTAQFMVPAQDAVVDRAYLDDVKLHFEQVWRKARWSVAGTPWSNNGRSAWDDTPTQRHETWEALWAQGGQRFMQQNYKDVLTDRRVSELVSEFVRDKIRSRVHDQDVAARLTPDTYLLGGRRTVVESRYFEAFNRTNVTLVDVASDPIERVLRHGARLRSGRELELSALVFATGFDAVTGPFLRIDIRGRDGATLNNLWAAGPRSYLGLAVSEFPNMFMVTGPGSTFGNHAVLMEHQVEWISKAIGHAIAQGANTVEASKTAQDYWTNWVDETAKTTVQFGTKSWFNGGNIPGKTEGAYVYLGSYRKYRRFCDEVAERNFDGLVFA